mgnify:CR=1 FL=1
MAVYEFSYSDVVENIEYTNEWMLENRGVTLSLYNRCLMFVVYIADLPFELFWNSDLSKLMFKDLNSIGENALIVLFSAIVFLLSYMYYWWDTKKDELFRLSRFENVSSEFDEKDSPYYKESAIRFVDFATPFYNASVTETFYPSLDILPVFRGFLDLHKEGWRMKIFPCSEERIEEEKRLSEERGEEYVIYPDVDENISEERKREEIMAKIGEL